MIDSETFALPALPTRAEYRRENRRSGRRSALRMACLTAGLATAFAGGNTAPVDANAIPTSITTSTGVQVFDGSQFLAGGSSYFTTPITTQGVSSALYTGTNGAAVVIFTQSPSTFIGQDFATFFNANEANVIADIGTNSFFGSDWNNFIFKIESLNLSPINPTQPISTVVFSNGTNGGTVVGTTIGDAYDGGFGLAAEPGSTVPEPGAMTTMLMGVLGLMGAAFVKMRRRRAN